MDEARSHLLQLLASHETWRSQTINLIASENALSPAVRGVLNSDRLASVADQLFDLKMAQREAAVYAHALAAVPGGVLSVGGTGGSGARTGGATAGATGILGAACGAGVPMTS